MRKIKINASRSVLGAGDSHVAMLYPFWGKKHEVIGEPDISRFDNYYHRGSELFEFTSLEKADVGILATEWKAGGGTDQMLEYCEQCRRAGKPVVIFFNNDSDEDIPVEGAIIFRTSAYRSKKKLNEFGLPAWSEDFLASSDPESFPFRPKTDKPRVGYCGYGKLQTSKLTYLKNIFQKDRDHSPFQLRSRMLSHLHGSGSIDTNFLLREVFWNNSLNNGSFDLKLARESRAEFLENIFDSDYVMCIRGKGNFSYRFYEVMCCGRIPLYIDTDCLLPFEDHVSWKDHVVWIDYHSTKNMSEQLLTFHTSISHSDFVQRQRDCRDLWVNWLSPLGFFSKIDRYF